MISERNALQQFEWAVRALAQDPIGQRDLFPGFVEVADELALEFEERYRAVRSGTSRLRPDQMQRVEALDAALEAMSGPEHVELWSMEALDHSLEWVHIRDLARQVVQIMGWPEDPPPRDRAIYVGFDA
jgi:hypothetical protein